MKTLLITPEYMILKYGNKYYHNSLPDHLDRYKMFGDITLCAQLKEVNTLPKYKEIQGVNVVALKKMNSIKSLLLEDKINKNTLRKEVNKADFIIAYVPSFASNYAVKCAKKAGKKTLLVSIACPWDALWNHSFKGKLVAPIATLAKKKAMKQSDYALYVTTRFLQNRYPTKGWEAGISDVVLSKVADDVLEERIKKIESLNINDPKEEIKLITTGAVNVKYKRQSDVISAIAKLKNLYNLHYYLAGYGDQTYLKNKAKKLGVEDRVHFLGMIPHDKVFSTLQQMDIYVQPSKQEGLPRALVEAMSIGLPCIGSNAGGIPELLSQEYIFKKGNITDLVKHIEYILHKKSLLESSKLNYDKAKEFSAERLNEKRNDFLNQIKNDLTNT